MDKLSSVSVFDLGPKNGVGFGSEMGSLRSPVKAGGGVSILRSDMGSPRSPVKAGGGVSILRSDMGSPRSPVKAGGGVSILSSKANELKAMVQKGSARPKNDTYNPG